MSLGANIALLLTVAVLATTGIGALLWWALGHPSVKGDEWKASDSFDFAKVVLAIVGGIGAVVALVIAYRRQQLGEAAEEREKAAQRREDDKLFSERFTKAADQLGSDKAPVRLAGMYALEGLAQGAPEQRQMIANVLCAYLRMPYLPPTTPSSGCTTSAAGTPDAPAPSTASFDNTDSQGSHVAQEENERREQERQVRLTAQRILTAHLRPGENPAHPAETFWGSIDLDLTGATLVDLDLSRCQIHTAQFNQAQFTGDTWFNEAQFTGTATFSGAQFTGTAWFNDAQFGGDTGFSRAQFTGTAWFNDAQFGGAAHFGGAQFTRDARFYQAQFTGTATFSGAQFTGTAWFDEVQFTETAMFGRAQFSGAQFTGAARFIGAQFTGEAQFGGAQFTGDTYFNKAQFTGDAWFNDAQFGGAARFIGAQFTGNAYFNEAQFTGNAEFDEAQFGGAAHFGGAQFTRTATFNQAQFTGDTWFNQAQFTEAVRFDEAQFGRAARFDEAQFGRTVRFDGAKFGRTARFDGARVRLDLPTVVRSWPDDFIVADPSSAKGARLPGQEGRWGYLTRISDNKSAPPQADDELSKAD